MENRKGKKVKKRRPMAGWALNFLKLSQHISACTAVLCLIALIFVSSVYQEQEGSRIWLRASVKDEEDRTEYFSELLSAEIEGLLRFSTIRSQLETDGRFDVGKIINISEYFYRKTEASSGSTGSYFKDAVYRLEDLLRWQQSGGLKYIQSNYTTLYSNRNTANYKESAAASEGAGQSDAPELAQNSFLTVDGKRIEDIVVNASEYAELCNQLQVCMRDLENNYQEYRTYLNKYDKGETSLVYYMVMDNDSQDIYTNVAELENKADSYIKNYFAGVECAIAGTTSLELGLEGDLDIPIVDAGMLLGDYEYAIGDNAVLFLGLNMELDAGDTYSVLWNGYAGYDYQSEYVLLGIVCGCILYYLLMSVYMMCVAGNKTDEEQNEYIELKWTDAAGLEIFLLWSFAIGFTVFGSAMLGLDYLRSYRQNYIHYETLLIILFVTWVFSVLVLESLCSLARRIKSSTLFKNSIIYKYGIVQIARLYRFVRRKCRRAWEDTGLYMIQSGAWKKTWVLWLVEMVFAAVCIGAIVILVANGNDFGVMLAALFLLVTAFMSYRRMKRKVERAHIVMQIEGILAGKEVRIEAEKLSVENAALGYAVNEIGAGIREAVDKSIKDERLKTELLTNVSHDIKTPLTSIINYVNLLKNEKLQNPKAEEYINVLENKSQKLKNLIQDLIEVSKISTGNIEYEMMPLNFHELLMQAVGEYEERLQEHCLKTVYNNQFKDATVMADPRRMWRVVDNVFSNIYKYALEGTRVYVEVTKDGDNLVVMFKNVSAKELNVSPQDLMERFVRGDLSRTTEGSGLGLAIAKNLVVGQGGSFQIDLDGDLFKTIMSFPIQHK